MMGHVVYEEPKQIRVTYQKQVTEERGPRRVVCRVSQAPDTAASERRVNTKVFDLLTTTETGELASYEETIERGRAHFIDVGQALMAIRDKRLYRGTHRTFEGYCQERWNFGRRYAGFLIQSVKVVSCVEAATDLGTNVPKLESESQARALAKAPPELQPAAWKAATEDTPKPTAKQVRRAVQSVTAKRKPTPKPDIEVDAKDPPLTAKCIEARDSIRVFRELQKDVQSLRRKLKTLADTRLGKWLNAQGNDFELKQIWNDLKGATPFGPCPLCAQKGCNGCKSNGWVSLAVSGRLGEKAYPFTGTTPGDDAAE